MADERKPMQLDADVEYSGRKKTPDKSKKDGKALPWLLAVLAGLAVYAVIDLTGGTGVQTELTQEQAQVQETVAESVRGHIDENGVPDDPSELDLPPGSDIVFNEDGSWIVSTADGQLISSPGALTPR